MAKKITVPGEEYFSRSSNMKTNYEKTNRANATSNLTLFSAQITMTFFTFDWWIRVWRCNVNQNYQILITLKVYDKWC
jgi:hypothetical protein